MPLIEQCACLDAKTLQKIVLILDASESAREHQDTIIRLADEVMEKLGTQIERRLCFLGCPDLYSADALAANSAIWFAENQRRASLVSPIFDSIAGDDGTGVVIIGAGPVYDLDDWEGTGLLQNTLLANVGESLQSTEGEVTEISDPTPQQIVHHVHDPPVRAMITCSGFAPVTWTNFAYRLDIRKDGFALVADNVNNYGIELKYRCLGQTEVEAEITCASGRVAHMPLRCADPAQIVVGSSGHLTQQEVEIFRKAARREPFTCPHCGGQEEWNCLKCLHDQGGAFLGRPIYTSLDHAGTKGFVVLEEGPEGISYRSASSGILALSPERLAVADGARVIIYRFDESQSKWIGTSDTMEQYSRLREGGYAVHI